MKKSIAQKLIIAVSPLLIIAAYPATAETALSAMEEDMLEAQMCIDAYSTRVFLDGGTADNSVLVGLVQCSESIGLFVDSMIQEVEKESGASLSDDDTSRVTAKLISNLRNWWLESFSTQEEVN